MPQVEFPTCSAFDRGLDGRAHPEDWVLEAAVPDASWLLEAAVGYLLEADLLGVGYFGVAELQILWLVLVVTGATLVQTLEPTEKLEIVQSPDVAGQPSTPLEQAVTVTSTVAYFVSVAAANTTVVDHETDPDADSTCEPHCCVELDGDAELDVATPLDEPEDVEADEELCQDEDTFEEAAELDDHA